MYPPVHHILPCVAACPRVAACPPPWPDEVHGGHRDLGTVVKDVVVVVHHTPPLCSTRQCGGCRRRLCHSLWPWSVR